MKTLNNFDFNGKRVLVRCDFNVPLDERGLISDDFRIKQAIPTIEYLIGEKAKVILMSHLDDPKGKVVESLRLDSVKGKLIKYLGCPVEKSSDCVGKEAEELVNIMRSKGILLLENLRFHKEEEENDPVFAKALSNFGEVYINEAFSCSHRSHASIVGIPKHLPAGVGFLFMKEIEVLNNLLKNPQKPLLAIIGGKKVETKSKLIDKISEIADCVLISGLIGEELKEKKIKLKYPQKIISPIDDIETFDIGPKTVKIFDEKISQAKTIFWNGPLGMVEKEEFQSGSKDVAKAIIQSKAFSVIGGGETVEFIKKMGLIEKFSHVSTGGGALLAYLSGENLPGIEALG